MMANAKHDEPAALYRAPFDSSDADIILQSTTGVSYRVPSFVLRNTSGHFRALLQGNESWHRTPIPTDVDDHTLDRVLRMICGLETQRWESFDELEAVITLAERWDTPGPLSAIRSAITAPLFLAEPLRLYVVASHFGWEEETKIAATQTLSLSLYEQRYQLLLHRLSTKHLIALLGFHRRRRDEFKRLVDSDELFNAGNAAHNPCRLCGERTDNSTWRELKARMFVEMDRRPLGDTLTGLEMEEWPESAACWAAKCTRLGCGELNYNKLVTFQDIKTCVDRLPSTIIL
ncbi:hypothetical protein BD779DRAFT_1567373 [Infundibulicybe gibba]|nr:hypothetical protein BD779DRAFT_1567373 [Infundibulicybe gibba]